MNRSLYSVGLHNGATGLIGEQIDCVGRMVLQQVIRPTTRLPQGVHVGASKKVGLHIHLLNVELLCFDLMVNPLMAGIETTCVTTHGHFASFFGNANHFFSILPTGGKGNFDLNVFTRFQSSDGLRRMHLGGRAQNDGIDFG